MTLPAYFLRRFVASGGTRLPKRPGLMEPAGFCPVCKRAVQRSKILGQDQLLGVFQNGFYYHNACRPMYNPTCIPAIVKAAQDDKGNLHMEEYRYWIGYRAKPTDSKWAMCRCCRKMTYSQADRDEHFRDIKYVLDGDACSTRLVNAYKHLLELKTCIVCKKDRYGGEKWGVPLCRSVLCQTSWMFDSTTRYIQLAAQLHLQLKKVEFKLREKAKAEESKKPRPFCHDCGVYIDNPVHQQLHGGNQIFINCTSEDSKTGVTKHLVWCNICKMYTDNINHTPVHNAIMRGGQIVGES